VTKRIVLLDAGSAEMRDLGIRIREMGYRLAPVKTPDQAERLLMERGGEIGAMVIPVDLPAFDLGAALRFLRRLEPTGELTFVAAGGRPDADGRKLLRQAGVELALWGPVDDHTLRFQVNRALAESDIVLGNRQALRAPTDWPAIVWAGRRRKPARVYAISAGGAYLSTLLPSLPNASIGLDLPLPSRRVRVEARVVSTNVPGNLVQRNLPVGMAVRFERVSREVSGELHDWIRGRLVHIGF
jgi:hypothetical protein